MASLPNGSSKKAASPYEEAALLFVERAMGVEPTSVAWEATVLPMNYARAMCNPSTFAAINPSIRRPVLQAYTQNPEAASCDGAGATRLSWR